MANQENDSQSSSAVTSSLLVAAVEAATTTTWPERLLLNLFSYSVVLVPIALIVIACRSKLLPQAIASSTIIEYFVYGSSEDKQGAIGNLVTRDDGKLLLDDKSSKTVTPNERKSSSASSALGFIWCLLGLLFSYLIWGLLQEKIMTTRYPHGDQWVTFHDSQFLVLINRLVAFIMAILGLVYTQRRRLQALHLARSSTLRSVSNKSHAPLYSYVHCSLSNILSSWCQYEALKYIDFPTQCLSKSCKVIPTMVMSKIMLRKRHPPKDYLCAALLAIGMFIFMLNQQSGSSARPGSRDDIKTGDKTGKMLSGLTILSLYLTFDSFTSNWQSRLYSQYEISNWQMMAAVNFYSILLTLTSLHQLGSLRPAMSLLASSPSLMRDCLVMSLTSSVGQIFVYHTIKRFGSVVFSVIMTLRQFLSILLSCLIYKHEITFGSSLGLVLVLLVVAYQTWIKMSPKKRENTSGTPFNQLRS